MEGIQSAYKFSRQLVNRLHYIPDSQKLFEDAKAQVVKAQKIMATAGVQYKNEQGTVQPKIEKVNAELKELATKVNSVLMEKYKNIRSRTKKGDIVVPINGNRCGGCHFELPLSQMHTATTNGYIVCEECEKIIYKG